jgi:hypothetical protein
LDFLPCQAFSVACECLFSAGGEITTKRCAQLGSKWFEELQLMKFAWRNRINDLASYNSEQIEEIDDSMKEYQDFLAADQELEEWDVTEHEIV